MQVTEATPSRPGLPAAVEAVSFALVALAVYWATGPTASGDVWPPLAEAFANAS